MEEKKKNLIRDHITELEQKVSENKATPNDFKSVLYELQEAKFKIQKLLDLVREQSAEFENLYYAISGENFADLVDKLNRKGILRKKDNKLKEAFKKQGYRIMEQTRATKRDDVFHGILRVYMAADIPFDKELLFAFKNPSDEMFKVLIFSFLSGIIE